MCWGDPCALGDCVSWGVPCVLQAYVPWWVHMPWGRVPCVLQAYVPWRVHMPWGRVHRHWGPLCPAVSTHLRDPGEFPLTAGAQVSLLIPMRGAGIPIRPTSLA